MEDINKFFEKIKYFEIEMLKDRGYPIKLIHFKKYFEVTNIYSWHIRLKFNADLTKDMISENKIIYKDTNVIVDDKGLIIFFEETYNQLVDISDIKAINVADIEVDNQLTKNGYSEVVSEKKIKLNTGMFTDILTIYTTFENIEKSKIQSLYKDIENFAKYIEPKKNKSLLYNFNQEITRNLNLITIVSDVLSNPSDLFNDIKFLFKNIEYFKYSELKFNPTKHVLVPKHEIMRASEILTLLKDLKIDPKLISKSLPLIRKDDRISRHYLFEKGNVIRIRRLSLIFPGEYVYYYRYVI